MRDGGVIPLLARRRSRASEEEPLLRCEVGCPLETVGAGEAQVFAERVAHRVDESVGAARREAVLPPDVEHPHAGSVTVYVLSGTIRSQLAGGPVLDYHAGQSFFEPLGAVHVLAENPSATEPAQFMAIHIADEGAQLTVYH